jgi:hydrogenase maturation factor
MSNSLFILEQKVRYSSLGREGNTDLLEFSIIKTETLGSYVLVHVNFPSRLINKDKIILIKGKNAMDIMNLTELDPHFRELDNYYGLNIMARFHPSESGWDMGMKMMRMLNDASFS